MPVRELMARVPLWEFRLWEDYHALVAGEREAATKTGRAGRGNMPTKFGGR